MKPMKVAEARARFGEVLDEAEKGATVVIERRGVRYRVVAEQAPVLRQSAVDVFDFVDADVLNGQWIWEAAAGGLAFKPRRKRR